MRPQDKIHLRDDAGPGDHPVAARQRQQSGIHRRDDNSPLKAGKPSIHLLFVDDDANVCRALWRIFRPRGFTMHSAYTGEQALRYLDEYEIDVLITDMRMPGMSGAELLEIVTYDYPTTHRILVTGYAGLRETTHALRYGFVDDFLTKPWEPNQIEECVLRTRQVREALSLAQIG